MTVRLSRSLLISTLAAPAVFAAAGCADPPVAVRTPSAVTPAPGGYVPGTAYFGRNSYIEYIVGNLPVIFSAPHGGSLTPGTIPVRQGGEACGGTITDPIPDANTEELVRAIQSAFVARTGGYPHVVVNRLHRNRLDANRDSVEAACGNPEALEAWRDYHAFMAAASARVLADHGRGWYSDIHGHGHAIQRLELGYELSATSLRRSNAELDASPVQETSSSIRTLSEQSPLAFSALLRGPTALGTLFADAGYPSTPSQQDAAPDSGESYFNGGYNTDRYACPHGGQICGVQIEANRTGVRDNATNRANFAATVVLVYTRYLGQFGITIPPGPGASARALR